MRRVGVSVLDEGTSNGGGGPERSSATRPSSGVHHAPCTTGRSRTRTRCPARRRTASRTAQGSPNAWGSPFIVGLTVVALGTSLPELATTVSATIRNNRLLAIGTLIGSSIYNLTFVLGGSLLFAPGDLGLDPKLVRVDLPAMVGAVLLCVPVFFRGRRITRPEGMLFVTAYAAYLTYSIGLRG